MKKFMFVAVCIIAVLLFTFFRDLSRAAIGIVTSALIIWTLEVLIPPQYYFGVGVVFLSASIGCFLIAVQSPKFLTWGFFSAMFFGAATEFVRSYELFLR